MHGLSERLCRALLPRVLSRACGHQIPRSGEAGERVNCFTVSIDKDKAPYLIIQGLTGDTLKCIEWDGSHYATPKTVPLRDVNSRDLYITHYYGLSEIKFFGIASFVRNRLTAWPYIKIHLSLILNRLDQYIFNKKKLVTKQRMDLLKSLVELHLNGVSTFDAITLMTHLYAFKWVAHPDSDTQREKLTFYLDSLVDTGELKNSGSGYALTGKALHAIEEYEEQERRHTENVKMQRRMFWLTLAIVALTVVQVFG